MNRALVFPLLGPALVTFEVWLVTDLALSIPVVFIGYLVTVLTLPVSVVAGLLDRRLARSLPALLRAPLTAAISTIISVVFVLAVLSAVFPEATSMSSAIDDVIGAGLFLLLPMGVCSLLSNDCNNRRRPVVVRPATKNELPELRCIRCVPLNCDCALRSGARRKGDIHVLGISCSK
jgi:hypothetical protein